MRRRSFMISGRGESAFVMCAVTGRKNRYSIKPASAGTSVFISSVNIAQSVLLSFPADILRQTNNNVFNGKLVLE